MMPLASLAVVRAFLGNARLQHLVASRANIAAFYRFIEYVSRNLHTDSDQMSLGASMCHVAARAIQVLVPDGVAFAGHWVPFNRVAHALARIQSDHGLSGPDLGPVGKMTPKAEFIHAGTQSSRILPVRIMASRAHPAVIRKMPVGVCPFLMTPETEIRRWPHQQHHRSFTLSLNLVAGVASRQHRSMDRRSRHLSRVAIDAVGTVIERWVLPSG
jgi:hypothetical protein